jgi:hypothetical protein
LGIGFPLGLSAAFFLTYSLLLEYQIWGETTPKFFGGFGMEVVWNVGEHFGTVREKLDKFPTLWGFG